MSSHMGAQYDAENATRLLASSRFAVEPRGDTPERRNMYEALHAGTPLADETPAEEHRTAADDCLIALHAGTPLVFTSSVAPPLRLPGWEGLGIETAVTNWDEHRNGHEHPKYSLHTLRTREVERALARYDAFLPMTTSDDLC